ncbi:MAG: hypothetical protein VKN13_02325 [Cyanobacteriota bacterium]|nr:hypothetical protein [Cyanobacteriota bacterium]
MVVQDPTVIDLPALARLYASGDDCPGPYRIVHKRPALTSTLRHSEDIDHVVADTLVAHVDFVNDIAHLTAAALLQVHGGSANLGDDAVRATAAQVATSLAVALLRSRVLEEAVAAALVEQGAFGQAFISCPE